MSKICYSASVAYLYKLKLYSFRAYVKKKTEIRKSYEKTLEIRYFTSVAYLLQAKTYAQIIL